MLGYRNARNSNVPWVDTALRVANVYDHVVHRKGVRQIIRDRATNYSTIRHILLQYYLFGRTDTRKFRQKGQFYDEQFQSGKAEELGKSDDKNSLQDRQDNSQSTALSLFGQN